MYIYIVIEVKAILVLFVYVLYITCNYVKFAIIIEINMLFHKFLTEICLMYIM